MPPLSASSSARYSWVCARAAWAPGLPHPCPQLPWAPRAYALCPYDPPQLQQSRTTGPEPSCSCSLHAALPLVPASGTLLLLRLPVPVLPPSPYSVIPWSPLVSLAVSSLGIIPCVHSFIHTVVVMYLIFVLACSCLSKLSGTPSKGSG